MFGLQQRRHLTTKSIPGRETVRAGQGLLCMVRGILHGTGVPGVLYGTHTPPPWSVDMRMSLPICTLCPFGRSIGRCAMSNMSNTTMCSATSPISFHTLLLHNNQTCFPKQDQPAICNQTKRIKRKDLYWFILHPLMVIAYIIHNLSVGHNLSPLSYCWFGFLIIHMVALCHHINQWFHHIAGCLSLL